jgi:hypothetical protein
MAAINPYSLNPNQMRNQMMDSATSTQNLMPLSNNPDPVKTTGSYSLLQNQQSLQNQQAVGAVSGQPTTEAGGNAGGIIANQMRSRSASVAPSNTAAQNQEQSGLKMKTGISSNQASMNASPKMTVY